VNLLLALLTAGHLHHDLAHDWFADQRALGWATCPLTENGFVRIMGQRPRSVAFRPADSLAVLRTFTGSGGHEFWPDTVTLRDERVFDAGMIMGPKQVTDVYLLGLATLNDGALATFDQSIPLRAVRHATKANLQVISAAPMESTPGDR
jgi:toxin-antitoxin system PIN domain toxin